MWSKISIAGSAAAANQKPPQPRRRRWASLPLSMKLAIYYCLILSGLLLVSSFLAIGGAYVMLMSQAQADIDTSAFRVLTYLDSGQPIDEVLLTQNLLTPGVSLRIYNSNQELILDSEPFLPGSREFNLSDNPWNYTDTNHHDNTGNNNDDENRPENDHATPGRNHGSEGEYRRDTHGPGSSLVKQISWHGDENYYLEFGRNLSQPYSFLHKLGTSLVIANLIALLFAIWSGNYLSKKLLRPIRDITSAAQDIEVHNLDKRLDIKGGDDELSQLAVTFNHMLDRIQAGFEKQRRFISDASHELRTPITVISGYADMLDRWGKSDESALSESIEAIKSEADNMHSLIEKLLFLARADKGQQILNIEEVDMAQLVEEVYRDTVLIAPDHRVELTANDPAAIRADAGQIKQMLRIFVDNSIKYTPAGGTIRLSSRQSDGFIELCVEDTGIGISADELPRVFDRFYRVDQSRAKITGGTGLGLSIASWIAEQHGFKISMESYLEEGTRVTVIIPAKPITARSAG